MSKKLIALLLALSMVFALAGCSIFESASDFVSNHVSVVTDDDETDAATKEKTEDTEEEKIELTDYTGYYVLESMVSGTDIYSTDDFDTAFLQLDENGTGEIAIDSDTVSFTWTDTELTPDKSWDDLSYTSGSDEAQFTVSNGEVTVVFADGAIIAFQKADQSGNSGNEGEFNTKDEVTETSTSTNYTSYSLYSLEIDGTYYELSDIAAMGISDDYGLVEYDDGTAIITMDGVAYDAEMDDDYIYVGSDSYLYTTEGDYIAVVAGSVVICLEKNGATNASTTSISEEGVFAYYIIYALENNEYYFSRDALVSDGYNSEFALVLYEDGTASILANGTWSDISWDESYIYDSYGDSVEYAVGGGMLTMYLYYDDEGEYTRAYFMQVDEDSFYDDIDGAGADYTSTEFFSIPEYDDATFYNVYSINNGDQLISNEDLAENDYENTFALIIATDGTGTFILTDTWYAVEWDATTIYITASGEEFAYETDESDGVTVEFPSSDIAVNFKEIDSEEFYDTFLTELAADVEIPETAGVSSSSTTTTPTTGNTDSDSTKYVLYQMDEGWDTISHEDVVEQGLDSTYYLNLYENGSGVFCVDGDVVAVTWDDSYVYTATGDTYEYRTSTDFLVLYLDNTNTILYLSETN